MGGWGRREVGGLTGTGPPRLHRTTGQQVLGSKAASPSPGEDCVRLPVQIVWPLIFEALTKQVF